MLAKHERIIVKTILSYCNGKKSTLISHNELVVEVNKQLSEKNRLSEEQLDESLRHLVIDGYFDVTDSSRKGQPVYCIILHDKAEALPREEEQIKRKAFFDLKMKILLGVIGAVVTFVIGIILKTTL